MLLIMRGFTYNCQRFAVARGLQFFPIMTIFALGVNHKTASVELRERVAFSPEQLHSALPALREQTGVQEAVIVSTCNRTELYCHGEASLDLLTGWLAGYHGIPLQQLREHSYGYQDGAAIAHLMAVASGLDSLVLGEPQILGQVKQAYQFARNQTSVGSVLERLFQQTFRVAKTVRTETKVGENAVSVAFAAVNLARQIFAELPESNVLLVGAGDTAELVAQHLTEHGVKHLMVANRTLTRAATVAEQFGGHAHTLGELQDLLPKADIVISSTASPLPIIGKGLIEHALKQRRRQPMLLIDLAVPRDIEAQVNELADAYLYTVDDLQGIITENLRNREEAAAEAQGIIQEHCDAFLAWLRQLSHVDVIRDYRQRIEAMAAEQLQRAQKQLAAGKDADAVLSEFSQRLTRQFLHQPTRLMRAAGATGDQHTLALFQQLIADDE
ncbi:glutamyl-tRNA reductase [Pseudidiomarina tainanensis]|uniref:Glutamyl-tRNA reductase n=3 Tax=Pseudidiomarina TaxID=2800384 RepID=A0A368V4C2_9GAMM|nr:glutamyl-tRNA reductase [Pseudidiomarina maritima]RBP93488.1 glutamyl-tRNA reductase [Pseudidiomarina tainanensis]RCW35948.1 glutamyl-tRNA reductase [Pseudidiomarina tainanensis]